MPCTSLYLPTHITLNLVQALFRATPNVSCRWTACNNCRGKSERLDIPYLSPLPHSVIRSKQTAMSRQQHDPATFPPKVIQPTLLC